MDVGDASEAAAAVEMQAVHVVGGGVPLVEVEGDVGEGEIDQLGGVHGVGDGILEGHAGHGEAAHIDEARQVAPITFRMPRRIMVQGLRPARDGIRRPIRRHRHAAHVARFAHVVRRHHLRIRRLLEVVAVPDAACHGDVAVAFFVVVVGQHVAVALRRETHLAPSVQTQLLVAVEDEGP